MGRRLLPALLAGSVALVHVIGVDAAGGTRVAGHVAASLGYDSQVNVTPDDAAEVVPSFGTVPLPLSRVRRRPGAAFAGAEARVDVVHAVAPRLAVVARAGVQERENLAEAYDVHTVDASVGLRLGASDRDDVSVSVQGRRESNDDELSRGLLGLALDWRRRIVPGTEGLVFARFTRVAHFPSARALRDTQLTLGGIAIEHAFGEARSGPRGVTLSASLHAGHEDPREALRKDIGRHFFGLRVKLEYPVDGRVDGHATVAWETSSYAGVEPGIGRKRQDDHAEVRLGLRWPTDARWSVRPELRWARNGSTVPQDDYDRLGAWTTVRYDF
ncbi:MAG: hypothetical protein H6983_03735 [Ectothiorhodospiraceae bacterium]|nr:hypothetical protein [Ectothiorhodospiraceae bacterium]